jgi:hypothetical protein
LELAQSAVRVGSKEKGTVSYLTTHERHNRLSSVIKEVTENCGRSNK